MSFFIQDQAAFDLSDTFLQGRELLDNLLLLRRQICLRITTNSQPGLLLLGELLKVCWRQEIVLKRAVAPTPAHRHIAPAHPPFEGLQGSRFVEIGANLVLLHHILTPSPTN